ncbi:unnamed protein product [Dovyalis caffra]|uniref:inositol-pentakisphosphate 2-kinase n=1 Tax=Dovyalis caffra TaxID=77055 RepID=A0AAV1S4V6_9ROSI|nr:unnamed protein product [Dovyalis caffra]
MEVKLEKKDAADWSYRGEGAANLVLAYTGSSTDFIGKVMRITKTARNGSPKCNSNQSALTEEERLLWRDVEELVKSPTKEIAEQIYTQQVMSPLLGPKHVDAGMRVLVTTEFLECVEKNVLEQRPPSRVDVSMVNVESDSVIIMSDHSLFPGGILKDRPCISVEIKPKCGFLPVSKFIAEGNSVKRTTTRFRMHQVLKLHEHEISELSEYDPLDLFSGSKERIHKAIKDLYNTPQNNFRIFLNGSLVFGGLGGGTKGTNAVVGKAFEDVLKGIIQAEDGLRTMSFVQLVAETVYCSRVLDELLKVQKRDNFDIEGAIHAYYNIVSQPCAVCQQLDEARLPHRCSSLHSIRMDESLKIVKDYLIAATAKDCSLMISFRPTKGGELGSPYSHVHLQSTNQSFNYKVNFIDLDLKPLKKMEGYFELDKKIVNFYTQMLEMEQKDGKCWEHGEEFNEEEGLKGTKDTLGLNRESDASTTILSFHPQQKKTNMWQRWGQVVRVHLTQFPTKVNREIEGHDNMQYQKTVVSVELLCSKCRRKVMKLIATIEGITSIVLDSSKNTVTVIGEADPVKIICKVREYRKSAVIMSTGPHKEEKKDDPYKKDMTKDMVIPYAPRICQSCDVWASSRLLTWDLLYNYCSSYLCLLPRKIGRVETMRFLEESLPPPPEYETILSVVAPLTASAVVFCSIMNDLFPDSVNEYLSSSLQKLSARLSSQITIVIEESDGLVANQMFKAVNVYLGSKLSPSTRKIKVNKQEKEDELEVSIDKNQESFDVFEGVKLKWVSASRVDRLVSSNRKRQDSAFSRSEVRYFELTCRKKHREKVLSSYLPYILQKAKAIIEEKRTVKLHTIDYNGTDYWGSVKFDHPATFDTIAMDPDMKRELIEDLDRFVERRDFYRRVGKAWKRGYLFYGPPGTGKSSLVAAMANHLKFDVYDLELKEVQCNSDLRRLLFGTGNRSILVIEDIDRSFESIEDDKVTLGGLLNFIDGLWSSCGDERIVVFTTNHKEQLDPALLRPGRMDVHLHMSYCTFSGFKTLAFNYLHIQDHQLFREIKELFEKVQATPAEVAGELMKSEDPEVVLQGLIKFLCDKETSETSKNN